MKEKKFYICERCGNIVEMVYDSGVNPVCCGEKMKALIPASVDASHEKHVPVYTREGDRVTVSVGSVAHPMSEEHSIEWIQLITDKGEHRAKLNPTDAPTASFNIPGEKPIAVYAYCNLHGLWRAEII